MKKSKGSIEKSRREKQSSKDLELLPSPPSKKKLKKAKHDADALKLRPVEKETLEELLERLGIKDWDFVIIGDGSGSNWNHECGWASVSIERITMERLVWNGCMNRGTVNVAEIMAYVQPLNWIAAREEDRRKKRKVRRSAYNIHIITDSQYCRDTGGSCDRLTLAKNGVLWAALDIFRRQGFVLHWHWIERETAALNRYADKVSKLARTLIKWYNLQEKMERDGSGDVVQTVYDVNPSSA